MDDTHLYESKFEASLSDGDLDIYKVEGRNKKHFPASDENYEISVKGSRVNIYKVKHKGKKPRHIPVCKSVTEEKCTEDKHTEDKCESESSTSQTYNDTSYNTETPHELKCSSNFNPGEFTPGVIVPTVPYKINDNYGEIEMGSLVFVDSEDSIRSLYNTPSPQTVKEFEGLRFISASHSLNRFQAIRTKTVPMRTGTVSTKVIFEQIGNDGISITQIEIDDITGTNANFAIDTVGNRSYVVGHGRLWVINRNNVIMLSKRMPSIDIENVHVIAAREESCYTAGRVNVKQTFNDVEFDQHLGYITHVKLNGVVAQLIAVKAGCLSFKGMYYYNDRLYITGTYKDQMYITKPLSRGKPDLSDAIMIGVKMPANTSFILALDGALNMVWWRILVSDNPGSNLVGDITCNKNNQVFTTCRFKGTLGLSEYKSTEVDMSITREDDAIVLIGLSGEFIPNTCPRISLPPGIPDVPVSWWRMIPVGIPLTTVTKYISLTNNGHDIVMSGYADVSLSDKYVINNHYFVAAFTPKLYDLYYHPIVQSVNNYNSRIIAISNITLFTGSTVWNNLYVFPFGMLKEVPTQVGYYITFSLRLPKLIGIVVCRRCDSADVQFSGYTNVYKDARVGRDYYLSNPIRSNVQSKLTTNNAGYTEVVGILGTAVYYGTAIKDGIIYINASTDR